MACGARVAVVWGVWLGRAAAAEPAAPPPEAAADGARAAARYHLFRPTPRWQMRELSTDRPDTTESPLSVDAGHVQVELDALSVARDQGVTELALGAANLKLGVTSFSDLQVIFEPYRRVGAVGGFGDLTLRNKYNLWGNDGGATALGVMPFVTLPTASAGVGAGHVEGGLIVPLGVSGPWGWDFGTMAELDVLWREDAYAGELLLTGTASHSIHGALAGFLELVSGLPLDGEPVALGANSGLTLGLGEDLVLDAGVRVGLSDAAEDFSFFVGGSARY